MSAESDAFGIIPALIQEGEGKGTTTAVHGDMRKEWRRNHRGEELLRAVGALSLDIAVLERRSGLDSGSLERQALKRRSSGHGGCAQAASKVSCAQAESKVSCTQAATVEAVDRPDQLSTRGMEQGRVRPNGIGDS